MSTVRWTTSLDRSLCFDRYFDRGKLRDLFYHRRWRKVDGDFRWCFFDTSENDVR